MVNFLTPKSKKLTFFFLNKIFKVKPTLKLLKEY